MISPEKNKSVRSPILRGSISPSPSRSTSPTRITVNNRYFSSIRFRQTATSSSKSWSHGSKKTCLCSPTNHPGSFRCSLHKSLNLRNNYNDHVNNTVSYRLNRLFARRSAMTNSLVRIGTVEGELVKRALAALIRPSSHQQRRRSDFRPRPSRLSVMSKADD